MKTKAARLAAPLAFLLTSILIPVQLHAQADDVPLVSSSGKAARVNTKVSTVKQPAASDQPVDPERVVPDAPEPTEEALEQVAGQAQGNAPQQTTPAPSEPSLSDLGFPSSQTQGSAREQALLNKRTHMLKLHQEIGLIAAVPMLAAVISGGGAKAKRGTTPGTVVEPSSTNLDLHAALGGATAALYFTSVYFAIRAPKVSGVKTRGHIRLHEELAWIHGPGMMLTPILGAMAFEEENKGQKVHGIASEHGTVAYVTASAYGAAIVSVSWPIKWKFWKGQ